MSLRREIVKFIHENPSQRYTNAELARQFNAPEPSVRRATLQALSLGDLEDGGPVSYNPSVVTYVATDAIL